MTEKSAGSEGIVFNIQKFTTHDGPGIRTEVFLKGCPLRCLWCANPEGIDPGLEIAVTKKRCLGIANCGYCFEDCPLGDAPFILDDGAVVGLRRDICTGCGSCARRCYSRALRIYGKVMHVADVMKEIRRDMPYYRRSGGGVTFSGGDAIAQMPFLLELLKACRAEAIHTCVESAFACDGAVVDALVPNADLFISDIKHMDDQKHRRYTGVSNASILKNLIRLTKQNAKLIVRIPIIPGYNDDDENIRRSGDFILNEMGNRILQLQLLKFHRLGEEKCVSLGIPYPMADMTEPPKEDLERQIRGYADYFSKRGIQAIAGTNVDPKA